MEKFAYQIAEWPASAFILVTYVMAAAGALVSGLTAPGRGRLPRVRYFVYSCAIYFAASLAGQVALAAPFAVAGGFLVVLIGFLGICIPLTGGFFLGRIAMARSRDAFDHPYGAILAFIPLANFYLLFASNREPVFGRQIQSSNLLGGGLGIVIGLVLVVSGYVLNRSLPARVERLTDSVLAEPDMQGRTFETLLQVHGPERTMDTMIEGMQLPLKLDDGRILIDMERQDSTLVYTYSTVSDDGASVELWRKGLIGGNCTNPQMRLLIEAGGTVEHVFLSRSDGYEDGRVTIDRAVCGY